MVGGLADWFAVTALFRHPLGLPIPHTAIIPQEQGPHRRGAGQFPQGEFPDRPGRRPAHAQHRRRRRRRPFPAGARGPGNAHPPGRLAAHRRSVRKPRRRAARRPRQVGGFVAPQEDGGVAAARPRARLGDQRGPPRADARGGDPLDGPRARRQRGTDPRHGAQARQLGAEARRPRHQARRRHRRWPAQADRRDEHRPGPPRPPEGRAGAGRSRQRPPDQCRDPRAGRGDEGRIARQPLGRPVARHFVAEGAARR